MAVVSPLSSHQVSKMDIESPSLVSRFRLLERILLGAMGLIIVVKILMHLAVPAQADNHQTAADVLHQSASR